MGHLLTNTAERQRVYREVDQAVISQNTSAGSLGDHTLDELKKITNNIKYSKIHKNLILRKKTE